MPAAFLIFSVAMPFLYPSSVKGNTSEESSSVIGDNLGHLGFVGISPLPLTSSWCATCLAVTRQGGFEAVGSLEIFLIVCHAHGVQVANRVSKRNNVLKALAGTNWGQQRETLLLTYKALGRSSATCAAPVWSTNASDTSLEKIQRTQNEALRIITGSHKMSSTDHLYSETKMLLVNDHLNLLSAQYLVHCLDTENVCHHITTMDHPPREMKETHFIRNNQTVVPLLANAKK